MFLFFKLLIPTCSNNFITSFYIFQPPPGAWDHTVDERENTVDQWKDLIYQEVIDYERTHPSQNMQRVPIAQVGAAAASATDAAPAAPTAAAQAGEEEEAMQYSSGGGGTAAAASRR